jgi:septal ring factor EnvC (AmiA/AmiB activator)
MSTDSRIIELLAEMLHEQREMRQQIFQILVEQREMRKDIQETRREQTRLNEELRDEQRRTTGAIWELTQIMQKIVVEPAAHQGREIATLKGKVATIESHLGLS